MLGLWDLKFIEFMAWGLGSSFRVWGLGWGGFRLGFMVWGWFSVLRNSHHKKAW